MASQVGSGVQVDYTRLARIREALEAFPPKVRLSVNRDLRQAGTAVTSEAAGRVRALATRGTGETARSYRTQVRARGIRIVSKARGGSILEFAGKVNPAGKTVQGASLIRTLNERYGPPGRILWAAWDKRAVEVNARITATVEAAERMLQSSLGKV